MKSETRHLVVVGGGPAGLYAAAEAVGHGMEVTVVEEFATLGGQYFRGRTDHRGSLPRPIDSVRREAKVLVETAVVDAPARGVLTVWSHERGARVLNYDSLALATGAVERAVALPGWTLPGVLTAGAASTLAKVHRVKPGDRVLVAGAGPFLLAAADQLSRAGCRVWVVDATTLPEWIHGIPILASDPEILRQTLGYMLRLTARGVRRRYGRMVTAIHGNDRVEAVTIRCVDKEWYPIPGSDITVAMDAVCLGFGFVPQLELAQLIGSAIGYISDTSDFFVRTDAAMRTSRPNVYAAGEVTGIGGARTAIVEGRIAGLTAAYDAGLLSAGGYAVRFRDLTKRLHRVRRLAEWVRKSFRPRPGLWSLSQPTTVVCRCEDVTRGELEQVLSYNASTPYAVKAMAHAGMGLCQGRICSSYLIEWLRTRHGYEVPSDSLPWRVRPPIRPVPIGDWLLSAMSLGDINGAQQHGR